MATNSTKRVTELDFDNIKQNLITFLRSQQEFKGYDFTGSSFNVLLDILAYNTHYNAFYLNMVANEMFLDSALLRNSVVSKAKALGYTPRSVIGAQATIDLEIFPQGVQPASITIDKNTEFLSTVNDITYVFNTSNSVTINKESNRYYANNVALKQGVFTSYQYTANTNDPDQKFILPNANTDTSTLVVKLKDSVGSSNTHVYTKANNITTVNSTSNIYFIQESTDGLFEVTFGDGVYGRKLQSGNIVVLDALISEGELVNGAQTFLPASNVGGYTNVSVTTIASSYAGAARESIDSIKFNAPRHYETQNRAVTVNDYRRILTAEYADVDSITVWGGEDNDPPVYGKVFIAIKPKSGLTLTDAGKDGVKSLIAKRKIVTVTPEIVEPDYTYMNFNCTVKYNDLVSTNSAAVIANNVKNTIVSFGTDELSNFDLRFRYSKLTAKIDNVEPSILNNLLNLTLTKKVNVTANTTANYNINFANEIYHPNDTYEGAVDSTTFTYDDGLGVTQSDCKIDDANTVIRVTRVVNGTKLVIANNVGSVNYTLGTINLVSFSPKALTGDTLDITVTPASSDIAPVREQILLIEAEDVTVTTIADSTSTLGSVTTSATTATSGSGSGGSAGSGGSSGY